MKRLLVLAVALVLLVVMVSSVSANVIIDPPTLPERASDGGSVSPEEGKASPILFRNGAASGTENVIMDPFPFPNDVPDDQYSLNGGSIIKIIVLGKRAATIAGSDIGDKPPGSGGVTVQGSDGSEPPPPTQPK